jgi:diacylglycerol diphosphate phosphatase/phosphatidate phosphatase
MLSGFITDSIKNAVGRPRPDLIDRCKPRPGIPEHELVTIKDCTQIDDHILQDGWRSFPSGHSSFAFAGLGYLTLFFCGQLFVFRPRTDLPKALLALFPLLGAALIAISRCQDYRHDVYDVTCGAILGFAVAYFSYRRYWPSLRSSKCDVPYSSKAMHDDGFGKLRADEEARAQQSPEDFDLEDIDSSDER